MAFRRWSKWASAFYLPSFPARPQDLALCLLHLAQTSASHSSTSQASVALHWLHQKADTPDPTRHPIVTQLRSALVKLYSRPVQRRSPLTPVQFRQIITCLASSDASLEDLQTAAMFVMAFFGFMRWDGMSGLCSQDFSFSESEELPAPRLRSTGDCPLFRRRRPLSCPGSRAVPGRRQACPSGPHSPASDHLSSETRLPARRHVLPPGQGIGVSEPVSGWHFSRGIWHAQPSHRWRHRCSARSRP